MPRNPSGVYALPSGSTVSDGETIQSSQHNNPLNDLVADANLARPVVAGGTGGTTAAEAREGLFMDIGRPVLSGDSAAYNRMLSNARYGEPLHLVDVVTRAQAEGIQEHTIDEDLQPTIQTLLSDDRAINVQLPEMGLITIDNTIAMTESQFSANGLHFGGKAYGRPRPVGGKSDLVIRKRATWGGGYAIDVNAAGTTAIQQVSLFGFMVDGNDQAGGLVRLRYVQDGAFAFTGENDTGYGVLVDGVWNSPFHNVMVKNCDAGGLILDPVTRENSNLSFYDLWVATCGGDGEVALKHQTGNTNGKVTMYNPLIEGPLSSGATASQAMFRVESAAKLRVTDGVITSEDGREAYCVELDNTAGGDFEDIVFTSVDFNNTGSSDARPNQFNLVNVPSRSVVLSNCRKIGRDKFFKSDAGTGNGAVEIVGGGGVLTQKTDVDDLNSLRDVRGLFRGVKVGKDSSDALGAKFVGADTGDDAYFGATDDSGVEQRFKIDPDAGTLDLQDLQLVLKDTTAPSSASDTGTKGEIRAETNYIYICVQDNTWKRVAIDTWS